MGRRERREYAPLWRLELALTNAIVSVSIPTYSCVPQFSTLQADCSEVVLAL